MPQPLNEEAIELLKMAATTPQDPDDVLRDNRDLIERLAPVVDGGRVVGFDIELDLLRELGFTGPKKDAYAPLPPFPEGKHSFALHAGYPDQRIDG